MFAFRADDEKMEMRGYWTEGKEELGETGPDRIIIEH
jgi:hypothetical protein